MRHPKRSAEAAVDPALAEPDGEVAQQSPGALDVGALNVPAQRHGARDDALPSPRADLYVDRNDPVCPLCGTDIGLAPRPIKPCKTLEALASHFANDCSKTRMPGDEMVG